MKTLVKTKSLLDGTGAMPIPRGWMLLENGKIQAVGKPGELAGVEGVGETLDLSDKYVLPGFVDSHIHLGLSHTDMIDPMPVTKQMGQSAQRKICKAVMYLREHLDAGVTLVRDMGEEHFIDFELRRAIQDGYLDGPRMVCSGNLITASHGQGQIGLSVADGPEEIRKACRVNLAKGADFIKIFVGGGVVSSEASLDNHTYNLQEIRTAVEEAQMMGKYVAAHIHAGKGLDLCIQAGVQSIEHACLATDAQIEAIAKAGCWVTGTFSPAMHPLGVRLISQEKRARLEQVQQKIFDVYRKLMEAGVKMSFGTDGVHGAISFEAINAEKCGASKMKAIQYITLEGARACRMDAVCGSLEPGKYADFVALDKDPLEDLEHLKAVSAVYIGGIQKK